ncbi:hypothetical protein CQY22_004435 [Mycolicibacterium brumae]|uniref:Uncharacterized protein n=2 Tax=Mycolicibacterium brumae TaxID=85968 RepID=A0A2G5PFS7_9MYCO|nr:hypothetical protein CQY22_004435 [Mycolicibacterium brumae]RWA20559.1 hypothetical protein MBRU_02565 [Mycolicibacterium brumae DSM 44177]
MASVSADYQLTGIQDIDPLQALTIFSTFGSHSGQYTDPDSMPYDDRLNWDVFKGADGEIYTTRNKAETVGGGVAAEYTNSASGPWGAAYYLVDHALGDVLGKDFVVDDYFFTTGPSTTTLRALLYQVAEWTTGSEDIGPLKDLLDVIDSPIEGLIGLIGGQTLGDEGTALLWEGLTNPIMLVVGLLTDQLGSGGLGDILGGGGLFGGLLGGDESEEPAPAGARFVHQETTVVQQQEAGTFTAAVVQDNETTKGLTDTKDDQKKSAPLAKLRDELSSKSKFAEKLIGADKDSSLSKRMVELGKIGDQLSEGNVVGAAEESGKFVTKRVERLGKDIRNGIDKVATAVKNLAGGRDNGSDSGDTKKKPAE